MDMYMKIVNEAIPLRLTTIFKYFKFKKNLNKFKKTINRGSPSFGVLWSFADFIKYSELIFFYPNIKKNKLFSSDGYDPGHNGFRINTEEYIITVKLYTDSQSVAIEVEYPITNRKPITYKFQNSKFIDEPDDYDIMMIDRLINIINKEIIDLVDYCVNKRIHDYDKP